MTARTLIIAIVFAVSMLLAGCEYAIPVSVSRNARKIQATLNPETASEILQKYLESEDEHGSLVAYEYESFGNDCMWSAGGTPMQARIKDGIVSFEGGPDTIRHRTEFQKLKGQGKSTTLPAYDATPVWFVNSKFEMDLTTVEGVVFWDPIHTPRNRPRELQVDLQWSDPASDPENTSTRRAPGTRSGTLSLYVRQGNNDELTAALLYFAPGATFTAAR